MRPIFRLLSLLVCLMAPALMANADVVHSVKFGMGPVAQVWGDAQTTPLASGPIVTGALTPVIETDGHARFKLATNAPYRIIAQRSDGQALRAEELADAGFSLAIEAVGSNAQATGQVLLQDNANGLVVYASQDRTAIAPGRVETQALAFFASWESFELSSGLVFTVIAG